MSQSHWKRICHAVLAAGVAGRLGAADGSLDIKRYVGIVLRSHPAAAQSAGLEAAAHAERQAARLFPDPVFEYSRDRARSSELLGASVSETSYSIGQSLPWPGRFSAAVRAGDRASDALRAEAESVRWDLSVQASQAFGRLVASRALVAIAREAEGDARAIRDLVARRAELGETRESDRLKALVEWLRQQRALAGAEREAEAREATLRALAVESLPRPLELESIAIRSLSPVDREALARRLVDGNPRLRASLFQAERQKAVLSVARQGRIPDVDLSVFRQTELDKRATGFSLGLRVPLWNASRGDIARAEAAAGVANAEADRLRIELLTELHGRLKELEVAADQVELLDRDVLPAAARSVALVRLSYQEGETSLLDLLDAQRTYRDAQKEAAEARLVLSMAVSEVQRLVGPDFDPWR